MRVLLAYRFLTGFLIVLVAAALFRRRPPGEQITAGMVLVPLILRVLLIK